MTGARIKKLSGIISASFSAFALLVVVLAIFVIISPRQPIHLLIVRSGSMEPALPVGSFVITKVAGTYTPGDIVTIKNRGQFVTHRIVEATAEGFVTKGDANQKPDGGFVAPSQVVGKAWVTIPWIGKWLAFIKTPLGYVLGVLLPAVAIIIKEIITIFQELRRRKQPPMGGAGRGRKENLSAQNGSIHDPLVRDIVHPAALARRQPAALTIQLKPVPQTFHFFKPAWAAMALLLVINLAGNSRAYFSDTAQSTSNVFTTSALAPNLAGLMIHEVLYQSSCVSASPKQWVELYNNSEETINLKNWSVKETQNDVVGIIHSNATVEPGEFVLLSRTGGVFTVLCYGQPPVDRLNINLDCQESFSRTQGVVQLINPAGTVVDRVEYGGPGQPSAPVDQSIERVSLGFDTAPGDTFQPSDFKTNLQPTPGFALPATQPLLINEFQVQPDTKEFIEIYNSGSAAMNMTGWALRLGNFKVLTALPATTLAPGQRRTFTYFHKLKNPGDKIYLTDPSGQIIDARSFHHIWNPPTNKSAARIPDGGAWQFDSTPTPNAANAL